MLSDEAVDILGNGSQTFHGCGMRADQPCENNNQPRTFFWETFLTKRWPELVVGRLYFVRAVGRVLVEEILYRFSNSFLVRPVTFEIVFTSTPYVIRFLALLSCSFRSRSSSRSACPLQNSSYSFICAFSLMPYDFILSLHDSNIFITSFFSLSCDSQ